MASNANDLNYSDLFVIESPPEHDVPETVAQNTVHASRVTQFDDVYDAAQTADIEDPGVPKAADEEEYIHDQLPSVEEIMLNANRHEGARLVGKRRSRRSMIIGCSLALGLVLLLCIVLPTKEKTPPPYVPESRLDNVVGALFQAKVSNLPDLSSPSTPQHRAAQFLADGDVLHLEIGDTNPRHLVERYILSLLYYHFDGPAWNFQLHFLSGMDHCQWWSEVMTPAGQKIREGVLCDENGDVVGLNLAWNNLQGRNIPSEIQHLDKLEKFHFYNNEISGELPNSMQTMSNLKSLVGMHCDLQGVIPSWLGDMTQLSVLALGHNKLHGSVPENFSKLRNLKLLALDSLQDGVTGDLKIFKNMNALELLYLENNRITGSLGGGHVWPNMRELDLSNNMLTGSIPASMLSHTSLQVLDVHNNFLSGDFPSNGLFENDALEYLAVQSNVIQGSISDRIGFFKNLKHLDLSFNHMTGSIPDTITQLSNLRHLTTSGNRFSEQPIPNVSELTNLVDLAMKDNQLVGTIPDWVGGLSNLKLLDLDANQLTGTIPSWIGLLQKLNHLLLNRNDLTGTLPDQMRHMIGLDVLLIDGNSIHGNANVICERSNSFQPSVFISDCYPGEQGQHPEIECRCCTTCCREGDAECNDKTWSSNFDPIWEYGYTRPSYNFNVENAPAMISKEYDDDSGEFAGPMDPFDLP
eukprot:CAMPEP_0117061506 /NCGR_PEP_ID=MMETSP0472-20121206/42815_1 /TAXON_ID=693140 ORGANISM="Tiarina fusus, Strain LIS" /NCGR_SAMPLE_ID=MMETSP0472 /ASSEMBLY_ACC=CAM_ASM_000603 /LENGTH=693 /DNA_ID=CAMNT_0004780201 /DNA_START=80 /DNA_END=2161 /DNA_ORIENTATION=+